MLHSIARVCPPWTLKMAGAASASSRVKIAALQETAYSICASIALGMRDLGKAAKSLFSWLRVMIKHIQRLFADLSAFTSFIRHLHHVFCNFVMEDGSSLAENPSILQPDLQLLHQ